MMRNFNIFYVKKKNWKIAYIMNARLLTAGVAVLDVSYVVLKLFSLLIHNFRIDCIRNFLFIVISKVLRNFSTF